MNDSELPSFLFRRIGYGLLILAFLNFVDILFPLHLMDPTWEFQTFGAIVDSSPIPLLGLALVFYGKLENRQKWEPLVLRFLSLVTLILGISFFLLIPGGLSSAQRINQRNSQRIDIQSSQQIDRIQQLQKQLNQATESQLETLLNQAIAQKPELGIKNTQNLKETLQKDLERSMTTAREQSEAERETKRFELFKKAFKWSLGSIISGFLFIQIWRATRLLYIGSRRKKGW